MSNLLLATAQNDATHYFTLSNFRGQILISTIILFAILGIACLSVFFVKREKLKLCSLISLSILLLYSVIISILFIIKGREDYTQSYQLMTTISLALAVVVAILLIAIFGKLGKSNLLNSNKFKIISIVLTVILGVLALLMLGLAVGKSTSIDALDPQAQIYMIAGVFIALIAVIFFVTVSGKKVGENDTLAVVYAAICIAISFALSYVRIFKMPQGGSITLASLVPIAVYGYIFGVRRGLLCCFVYGLLQAIQDPWVVHPLQFLLDYPIAFLGFGFAGVIKKFKPSLNIVLGLGIGIVIRYISHMISGAVFFGTYGEAYGITSPWLWGSVYNLFVFIDGAIAVLCAGLLLSSRQMLLQLNSVKNKFRPKIANDLERNSD